MRSFLLKAGWTVALLTVAAFFLPWIKLEVPVFNKIVERQLIANQLEVAADLPWYQRLVLIRPPDLRAALDHPLAGNSGLTMVQWTRGAAPFHDRLRAKLIGEAFGVGDLRVLAVLFYAIPALALVGMALMALGLPSRLWVLLPAIAAIGFYFLARSRLDETFLDRATGGVVPGIGLWLALFGLGLVGIVLLIDAVLPDGQR